LIATTAFVANNAPINTTTTITNNSTYAPNITMIPSPTTIISTYIPQTGMVTFNNSPFTIQSTTSGFQLYICSLVFFSSPYPGFPPAVTTGTINVSCTTNATIYNCNWLYLGSNNLAIQWPTGLTTYNVSFIVNLQNLGSFHS
jgi:hypothetical protein